MKYDVVVATKDRFDVLQVSLVLILEQTKSPSQLIVVDSSVAKSVASQVAGLCESLNNTYHTPIKYIRSPVQSITYQRNLGLKSVDAELVMFPDDDSLWYPQTAENLTKVYQQDVEGLIGGVSCVPVNRSPLDENKLSHPINRKALFRSKLLPLRNKIEDTFWPNPLFSFAQQQYQKRKLPQCIDNDMVRLIPSISGYCMGFRTKVIRQVGFDEVLGYKVGYCFHEDRLASAAIINKGYLLVGAHLAPVFHHVNSDKRAGGFHYGFSNIFNYIYICVKETPNTPHYRRRVLRFLTYKLFLFSCRKGNQYHIDIYTGAKTAFNTGMALFDCTSTQELESTFRAICDEHLGV